jgi:hypothetical protein
VGVRAAGMDCGGNAPKPLRRFHLRTKELLKNLRKGDIPTPSRARDLRSRWSPANGVTICAFIVQEKCE